MVRTIQGSKKVRTLEGKSLNFLKMKKEKSVIRKLKE